MRLFPSLYAILDPDVMTRPPGECARELVEAGVEIFQYRAKRATSRELFDSCRILAASLTGSDARLILNDRSDIAAFAGVGGVHVGQDDLSPDEARKICGEKCWVGISTHNLEQVRAAGRTSADYVAVGPIFATTTKEKPDPVVGTSFIHEARKLTQKPIVAIGGITLERSAEVFEAGADSVAVISDLLSAENPGARAREFLALAKRTRWSDRSARGKVSANG